MAVDLWPDEIATDGGLEGPTVVLKEQAALLGKKTNNLVEAIVESSAYADSLNFRDSFTLVSSTINYRYELFHVDYPLEFYQATIYWPGYTEEPIFNEDGDAVDYVNTRRISSREELEQELKTIFADSKTVKIIQALKTRSRL